MNHGVGVYVHPLTLQGYSPLNGGKSVVTRAGGLVVGHELPKLIARVQFPAGAYRRRLS